MKDLFKNKVYICSPFVWFCLWANLVLSLIVNLDLWIGAK